MNIPFSPIEIAPEVAAAGSIKQNANQLFGVMRQTFTGSYNLVWNNPNATPEAVVTALGPDADRIFESSSLTASLLNFVSGTTDYQTAMPSTYSYTSLGSGYAKLTKLGS